MKTQLWNSEVLKGLTDKRADVLEKKASSLGAKVLNLTKLLQNENELLIKERSAKNDLTELVEKLRGQIAD